MMEKGQFGGGRTHACFDMSECDVGGGPIPLYLQTGAYMSYQSSKSHPLPETCDDTTVTHDINSSLITHDYDPCELQKRNFWNNGRLVGLNVQTKPNLARLWSEEE